MAAGDRVCPTIGDVNPDNLVTVGYAKYLYCKVTICNFIIIIQFVGKHFGTV